MTFGKAGSILLFDRLAGYRDQTYRFSSNILEREVRGAMEERLKITLAVALGADCADTMAAEQREVMVRWWRALKQKPSPGISGAFSVRS